MSNDLHRLACPGCRLAGRPDWIARWGEHTSKIAHMFAGAVLEMERLAASVRHFVKQTTGEDLPDDEFGLHMGAATGAVFGAPVDTDAAMKAFERGQSETLDNET